LLGADLAHLTNSVDRAFHARSATSLPAVSQLVGDFTNGPSGHGCEPQHQGMACAHGTPPPAEGTHMIPLPCHLPCIMAIILILTPWSLFRMSSCRNSMAPTQSCGNAGARSISTDGIRLIATGFLMPRLSSWALLLLGLKHS
jgi:hypothetical protein